jgi:hypothetical protein
MILAMGRHIPSGMDSPLPPGIASEAGLFGECEGNHAPTTTLEGLLL